MKKILIPIVLIIILPFSVWAQHQVRNSVIGNGVTNSAGSTNNIQGTLGPPIIGSANTASHVINSGFWSQAKELVTSVEELQTDVLPKEFQLHQNYPNPFNPSTTIIFALPKQTHAKLNLYDVLGRRIGILLDNEMEAGVHQLQFDASDLVSGIYLYRLEAEGFMQTRKLMLLK